MIVVLGVHRSGTSAITRGLQIMGVGLGDRMMPPIEGNNPKGFWEDIDLNALNIEMLSAIDSDWDHLAAIDQIDVEILHKQGYFLRALELLRQKVSSAPIFGFKDPRVVKLLPFWKEVFSHCQVDVSYVLTLRHPLSVVMSLAKRDSLDPEKSYLLWIGHVITSFSDTTGDNRVLVDYDRLMHSPDHELNRIAKGFNLEIDPTELQSYKTEFLDQGLRHTVYDLNDLLLDDACPPLVREIYAALIEVASDKTRLDDLIFQKKVEQWVGEFERLKSPLILVDRLYTQKAVANQAIAECNSSLNHAVYLLKTREEQIAQLESHGASLESLVNEKDKHIKELEVHGAGLAALLKTREEQIAQLESHGASLESLINEKDKHIKELEVHGAGLAALLKTREEQIAQLESHGASLESLVNEKDKHIKELEVRGVGLESQITQIESQYTDNKGTLDSIYNSKGWKMLSIYYKMKDKLLLKPGRA